MSVSAGQGERGLVVEAVGLSKVFSDFWMRAKARAVDGIDFEIRPHEIFGLLGPNGSGKSTTIKMILGLLRKSKGKLAVYGRDPGDVAVKARIGYLPEESYMYRFLDAPETLDYYGKLFGLDHRTRKRRVGELLDMVGLSQVVHRSVGEYSKGMARRLGLAQALINDPEFLILDEPTSGLDPIGTKQVKDLLLELGRRGKTILLSSHLLADVESVCDRMVILYGGRIRAEGTGDSLLADTEHTLIRTPRLRPETIARLDQVINQAEGATIESVTVPRQRLEDLFIQIVETARKEQVTTSGALQGSGTAKFLSAGDSSGGQLITELETASDEKRATLKPQISEQRTSPERDSVLQELTSPKVSPPPAASAPIAPTPKAPKGADASFIDDLMKDSEGGSGAKG